MPKKLLRSGLRTVETGGKNENMVETYAGKNVADVKTVKILEKVLILVTSNPIALSNLLNF